MKTIIEQNNNLLWTQFNHEHDYNNEIEDSTKITKEVKNRPLVKNVVLLVAILCFGLNAHSQTSSALDGFGPVHYGRFYGGWNSPLGDYKDIITGSSSRKNVKGTNSVYGLAYDIGISRSWAMGIDINRQINTYNSLGLPGDLIGVPAVLNPDYRVSNSGGKGTINSTTFSFGPTWSVKLSPRTYLDIYSKVGLSRIGNATHQITFDTIGRNGNPDEKNEIFAMQSTQKVGLGVTTGLRLGWNITDKLSAFLNPQYVYSNTKIEYTYANNFRSSYTYIGNPLGTFQYDLLYTTRTINPSYFNINFGLTYRFGMGDGFFIKANNPGSGSGDRKPKKANKDVWTITALDSDDSRKELSNGESNDGFFIKANQPNSEDEIKKRKIVLTSPTNGASFKSSKEIKKFTWKVVGKPYEKPQFKVTLKTLGKNPKEYPISGRLIEIPGQSFEVEWPTVLPSLPEGDYVWNVKETNSGDESGYHNLKIGTSSISMDFKNSTCSNPAFINGNVNYTGEIELNNPGSSTITITSFDIFDWSNSPATNVSQVNCADFTTIPFTPITVAPGSSYTLCAQYSVPFGETDVYANVNFTQSDLPAGNTDDIANSDTLPNCICNTCDGWKFSNKSNTVTQSGNSTMIINQSLQITGADPIKKVKAEIVYVNQDVNDPQCYTCTKEDEQMGLFTKMGNITTAPGNWINNGIGHLTDENNDNHGNQFVWDANDPQTGIDFSTAQNIKLKVKLPTASALDCCTSNYQVCVRYTYTDINCKTCTTMVCYNFTQKPASNDTGTGSPNNHKKK